MSTNLQKESYSKREQSLQNWARTPGTPLPPHSLTQSSLLHCNHLLKQTHLSLLLILQKYLIKVCPQVALLAQSHLNKGLSKIYFKRLWERKTSSSTVTRDSLGYPLIPLWLVNQIQMISICQTGFTVMILHFFTIMSTSPMKTSRPAMMPSSFLR